MISQYLRTIRLCDMTVHRDRLAFTCNMSGTLQLWTMPTEGGFPRQLTSDDARRFNWLFADYGTGVLDWSPDGRWIAAATDYNGDENLRIDLISPEGGAPRHLPWKKNEQCQLGVWSTDSRYYYYTSNRRNPKYIDVLRYEMKTGISKMILGDTHLYSVCRVPPRNGQILVQKTVTIHRTDLYLMDVKTRKMTSLTPWPDKEIEASPIGWDAKGHLWILLRRGSEEFAQLCRYETIGKAPALVQMTRDKWDKRAVFLNGRQLVITRNVAGCSHVSLMNATDGKERKTPLPRDGVVTYVRVGEGQIFFHYSSPWQSSEIYSWKIGTQKICKLTDLWNRALNPKTDVVKPKLLRYRSEAGDVYGHLYLPKSQKKPPCVVWIHGGPQSQEVAQYTARYQLFANRGYAVWVPNHRGSTGFGRSHCKAIERNWGGPDLEDLKRGLAYLRGLKQIDMNRLAVAGKSYGGYMALWCATQLPQVWKAAVDIYGPSNLLTMMKNCPAHWYELEKEFLGDLKNPKDRARLIQQSPITHIHQVKCPMLVMQGRNDPRVMPIESEQVVKALRARKKPVDYLFFEDEGHDFAKFSNECFAYERILQFLDDEL